jgi:hypothetical protein
LFFLNFELGAWGDWELSETSERGHLNPHTIESLPDYLSDLNARRDAWNKLTDDQKHTFRSELAKIANRKSIWWEDADFDHWPEAFLRTLGLWKEEA